MLQRASWELC